MQCSIEAGIATFKNNKCVDLYDWFRDFAVIIVENIQELRGKQSKQFEVARATYRVIEKNKQVTLLSLEHKARLK